MNGRNCHQKASIRLFPLLGALLAIVTFSFGFGPQSASAAPGDDFVFTVVGNSTQIPVIGTGMIATYSDSDGTHAVPVDHGAAIAFAGSSSTDLHLIRISGQLSQISQEGLSIHNVTDINQWGSSAWISLNRAFEEVNTFQGYSAVDTPDLSACSSLRNAFAYSNFNGPIGNWDISAITSLEGTFSHNISFNQPLDAWDTSAVFSMSSMFDGAKAFNQPLSLWNTSNVRIMRNLFAGAASFNQPLNSWNTSNAITMLGMFDGAASFNQPLNAWNTTNVTDMSYMFKDAAMFDQPLNSWNTSRVTRIVSMFNSASAFNQPLDAWNTENMTAMSSAFERAAQFNQPLSSWNTSNVESMYSMFRFAFAFDQSLASWNISRSTDLNDMLSSTKLSVANYDATLSSWANQPVHRDLHFGADDLTYSASKAARQSLIDNHGWTIYGDSYSAGQSHTQIQIFKIDSATGKGLAGAEYNIIDANGQVIMKLITRFDGSAITPSIPLGNYTIVEIKPPAGYLPATQPVSVTLDGTSPIVVRTFESTPAPTPSPDGPSGNGGGGNGDRAEDVTVPVSENSKPAPGVVPLPGTGTTAPTSPAALMLLAAVAFVCLSGKGLSSTGLRQSGVN